MRRLFALLLILWPLAVFGETGDPVYEGVHTGALYVNSGATPSGTTVMAVDPHGGVSVHYPTLPDHAATMLYVLDMDQEALSQVTAYVQSQVSEYPVNSSVSGWIQDAKEQVHSQVTEFVTDHTGPDSVSGVSLQNVTSDSMLYVDASGNIQEVALGANGLYLKSQGAGSPFTWDTPAGGAVGEGSGATTFDAQSGYALAEERAGAIRMGIAGRHGIDTFGSGETIFIQATDLHSQVSAYVQSQVSEYPLNSSVSNWITNAKEDVHSEVTYYVQSQVSGYPYNSTVKSWITDISNASAFAGVTDFALDSEVSAFVIAQDQGVLSQVTDYVQSQVSEYVLQSEMQSQVSEYPLNSSVSAWVTDASNQVNSQVSEYVQSQVSEYVYNSELQSQVSEYPYNSTVISWDQDVHSQVSAWGNAKFLTGTTDHSSDHESGGAWEVNHDSLAGFVLSEHTPEDDIHSKVTAYVTGQGFLTSETDPIYTARTDILVDGIWGGAGLLTRSGESTYSVTPDNSSDWDTAYGWGDHGAANYFDLDTDTLDDVPDGTAYKLIPAATKTSLDEWLSSGATPFLDGVDQALATTDTPTFSTVGLSSLTDGYIPYLSGGQLADSGVTYDPTHGATIHSVTNTPLTLNRDIATEGNKAFMNKWRLNDTDIMSIGYLGTISGGVSSLIRYFVDVTNAADPWNTDDFVILEDGTVIIGATTAVGAELFRVAGPGLMEDLTLSAPSSIYSLSHDSFADFDADEHIDWTVSQAPTLIHADNYTDNDTTYVSSDFNHDDLTGFVLSEHTPEDEIHSKVSEFVTGQGYLTAYTETDPVYSARTDILVDGIWGGAGLLKRTGVSTYTVTDDNSTDWDTAYGWGDHGAAGYLTGVTDHSSDHESGGAWEVNHDSLAGFVLSEHTPEDDIHSKVSDYVTSGFAAIASASATLIDGGDDLNSLSDGWYRWTTNPSNASGSYQILTQVTNAQKTQLSWGGSSYGKLYVRRADGGTFYPWTEFWSEDNDGTGSGLDADLWDGNQFASYLDQAVKVASSPIFAGITVKGAGASSSVIMRDSDNNIDGYLYAAGGAVGLLDDDADWTIRSLTDTSIVMSIDDAAILGLYPTYSAFSTNVRIPDAGYIGSASDPDAIQIEADGDVVLTQDLTVNGTIVGYATDAEVQSQVSDYPYKATNNAWTGENEFTLAQSGVSRVEVYASKQLTAKEAASTFVIIRTDIGDTPPTIQVSGTTPFISVYDRYGSGATIWTTGTLLYDSGEQFQSGHTLFWNSEVTGFQAQFAYIGEGEYIVTHNAPSSGTLSSSGATPFFQ